MKTIHQIINGDSREMNLVLDKSVQLIITSPPYWQLKDYGTKNQIGYHEDYETYINNLNLVWKESYRVLDDGCKLCVNIGDQFARAVYYGRYKVIPIRTEIIKKDTINIDIDKEFEDLPYRFVDLQNLDKKIDPKKLRFGSKIDKDSLLREDYFTVKEIISPKLVKLSNDLIVRLIGIKEKDGVNGSAKQFLYDKTKGQKVFMKFDNQKYDDQNHLLCYLYLKNKTFLNAHLIKEGLVEPDLSFNFKYKDKFSKLNLNG